MHFVEQFDSGRGRRSPKVWLGSFSIEPDRCWMLGADADTDFWRVDVLYISVFILYIAVFVRVILRKESDEIIVYLLSQIVALLDKLCDV